MVIEKILVQKHEPPTNVLWLKDNALFIYDNGTWIALGIDEDTVKDIYAKIDSKVSKEEGKGLSSNDLTDALLKKLNSLSNYDDTNIISKINTIERNFNTLLNSNPTKAIESFNEIIKFLEGIEDNVSLHSILNIINNKVKDSLELWLCKLYSIDFIEGTTAKEIVSSKKQLIIGCSATNVGSIMVTSGDREPISIEGITDSIVYFETPVIGNKGDIINWEITKVVDEEPSSILVLYYIIDEDLNPELIIEKINNLIDDKD